LVHRFEGFKKTETKINWQKKIVKLTEQPALGVDMCDVEEITDTRGEEQTGKN
jgi:hypothetical protein